MNLETFLRVFLYEFDKLRLIFFKSQLYVIINLRFNLELAFKI